MRQWPRYNNRKDSLNGLDRFLPNRLRQVPRPGTDQDHAGKTDGAKDAAGYILSQGALFDEGMLYDLAVNENRWRAAVWLVEHLAAQFHVRNSRAATSLNTVQQWTSTSSLEELTADPVSFVESHPRYSAASHLRPSSLPSLDELTDELPESLSLDKRLRHDILGEVWHAIGKMIAVSATEYSASGGTLRPDILEMIALLHHYELMPPSIYSYLPVEFEDAIQQPPTLHLLSSRIMTALSDATWRARESSALEAARHGGLEYHHQGPELTGSSYRVRVTTVKPEIWLELILWSCLHGGWTKVGMSLLSEIIRQEGEKQWRPISWRETLRAIMPFGNSGLLDWENIKFIYDTRSSATMDHVDTSGLRVERTISSEVIDAYCDVLVSMVDLGVGMRGEKRGFIIRSLATLRSFLERANLNLGGGSWDALMLRLADAKGVPIDTEATWIAQLTGLSPRFGQELHARHSRTPPPYIHDGSAAILGLLHRALRDAISQGQFNVALRVFRLLQERIDDDKNRSIHDFFESRRSSTESSSASATQELFTSNFNGIEYPALETQIPTNVLAAFMELVIDNKAYEFGHWMLFSDDIDGPIIPTRLYSDPAIASALIRYAISTDNLAFLTNVVNSCSKAEGGETAVVPRNVLQAFLDAQIELRRWSAVERILRYMRDTPDFSWSLGNLGNMLRSVILLSQPRNAATATDGIDSDSDSWRAEALAAKMLSENIPSSFSMMRGDKLLYGIASLTVIMSVVDKKWATFCRDNRRFPSYFYYTLPTPIFNRVLEAVVERYGAHAGRLLVDNLSARAQRTSDEDEPHEVPQDMERMPRFRDDALRHGTPPRSVIELPGSGIGRIAMYGALKPDQATINAIYEQALKELHQSRAGNTRSPTQSAGVVSSSAAPGASVSGGAGSPIVQDVNGDVLDSLAWAIATSHRLQISQRHIWERLESILSAHDIEYLRLNTPTGRTRRHGEDVNLGDAEAEAFGDSENEDFVPLQHEEGGRTHA